MYLDPDYKFVLVGDPALKYLWILCREKRLDEITYEMLIRKAIDNGYDVTSIIRVGHDCN
jgi:apolipoprotein D and lipocalin family protein